MKKKILFIINPISGIGKKKILPDLIDKYIQKDLFDYKIAYTEYKGHARKMTEEAVIQGIHIVCVAGGDGSVNEVGTALINTSTKLGIIPSGSGNGIARHLGIPLKLKKAIQRINYLETQLIDTIQLGDKEAIGVCGFGFDAHIAKKFDEHHTRGILGYIQLVVREYRIFQGLNITINNQQYSNLLLCTFANTNQFGNNFKVSPESNVTDGIIEVVLVKFPKIRHFLNIALDSFFGKIHQSKYVEIIPINKASIAIVDRDGHTDGEPVLLKENEFILECKPKTLSVIV